MTKPVIAHVIPWNMCVGGAQRVIANLCEWARDWAELHIVHRAKGSDATWDYLREFVAFHPAETSDEAEAVLRRLQPDLIHHHYPENPWGIHNLFGMFPILGTPHGWPGNLNAPAWAVPICGPDAQIRHGVDLEHYRPGKRPQPDGRFHVGIVGRLREDKVPLPFLAALQSWLPRHRGQVVVHFIGRGLDDRCGRRVQDAARCIRGVHLHGDIPPNQMPDIYTQLDAILVPSGRDSVSLVAVEAMACGVPVIARNIEGLPETVGSAGVIADDDAALLAAVDDLRRNRATCVEMARRGRARATLLYDKRRMLNQYREVYDRHLKPAKSARDAQGDLVPDVSVVMPVGDGVKPEWFNAAVASIVGQTGVHHELVIVNDGVTDLALANAIIAAVAPSRHVRVIHMPKNRGIPVALNVGLEAARAELVARADADDIMPAGRLTAQFAIMSADPGITVLCGDMMRLLPEGRLAAMPRSDLRPNEPIWDYWEGNWPICHPTVMFRKHTIIEMGGYDESIPVAQDLALWCSLQAAGHRIEKRPDIWNHYRMHPNQITGRVKNVAAMTKEILDRYQKRRTG